MEFETALEMAEGSMLGLGSDLGTSSVRAKATRSVRVQAVRSAASWVLAKAPGTGVG
jgi:hypothetical protein